MAVERERGISVSSAVMSFEYEGHAFNLLDTPGHQDFSPLGFQREHLPQADRARQRGDGARQRPQRRQGGIKEQTRWLFSRSADCATCRSRPLSTSSTARPATCSTCWTRSSRASRFGMGRDFLGTYDLSADALLLFERGVPDRIIEPIRCRGLDDPKLPRLLPKEALAKLPKEGRNGEEGLSAVWALRQPISLKVIRSVIMREIKGKDRVVRCLGQLTKPAAHKWHRGIALPVPSRVSRIDSVPEQPSSRCTRHNRYPEVNHLKPVLLPRP
jgi:hypothetical protein